MAQLLSSEMLAAGGMCERTTPLVETMVSVLVVEILQFAFLD